MVHPYTFKLGRIYNRLSFENVKINDENKVNENKVSLYCEAFRYMLKT